MSGCWLHNRLENTAMVAINRVFLLCIPVVGMPINMPTRTKACLCDWRCFYGAVCVRIRSYRCESGRSDFLDVIWPDGQLNQEKLYEFASITVNTLS